MNKFQIVGYTATGAAIGFLTVAQTNAASFSGTNVSLDASDISAVASSYNGLGQSILNFIVDIGPVAVPLVAALWIGSKLFAAFKGRL